MKRVSLFHILRRGPAVCIRPPQSTHLAINMQAAIKLGFSPSSLPIAALELLLQRPGVLDTPRNLQAWTDLECVVRSPKLRTALESFASEDTPVSHYVACRLLSSCASLRASKHAVEYLARHLRNAAPGKLTASQCVVTICGLAACYHPVTDPLFATLIAKIKEKDVGCDNRLIAASVYCAALRPLFTPAFLQGVVQDIQAGVYKPPRAASMLLGLQFVLTGDTLSKLCNAMWQSHSASMRPKDRFKLMVAGGCLDDMRRSLSERSAEYLMVIQPFDLYHFVVQRQWNVGALQTTLEAALLPTVPRAGKKGQGRLSSKCYNVRSLLSGSTSP